MYQAKDVQHLPAQPVVPVASHLSPVSNQLTSINCLPSCPIFFPNPSVLLNAKEIKKEKKNTHKPLYSHYLKKTNFRENMRYMDM